MRRVLVIYVFYVFLTFLLAAYNLKTYSSVSYEFNKAFQLLLI